jgi:transcriptional regulator GlxA family with amidase domain
MSIAALVLDELARLRLRVALRHQQAELCYCRLASELTNLVADRWTDVVIVEPWDAEGATTVDAVRQIRSRFPALPILIYCSLTTDSARQIAALCKAGADEVLMRGTDDIGSVLREVMRTATLSRVASEVCRWVEPRVPADAMMIVSYCAQHAATPLSVAGVARALGINRKTLLNRLASANLPAPGVVISWCRLLVAAWVLEQGERPIEQVALALGFGSGTGFRNMLRRYTGLRPSQLRSAGGFEAVAERFTRACDHRRANGRREACPR